MGGNRTPAIRTEELGDLGALQLAVLQNECATRVQEAQRGR